ncbi:hypothetical protein ABPG74_018029 [Tetrahymena malaccensis]
MELFFCRVKKQRSHRQYHGNFVISKGKKKYIQCAHKQQQYIILLLAFLRIQQILNNKSLCKENFNMFIILLKQLKTSKHNQVELNYRQYINMYTIMKQSFKLRNFTIGGFIQHKIVSVESPISKQYTYYDKNKFDKYMLTYSSFIYIQYEYYRPLHASLILACKKYCPNPYQMCFGDLKEQTIQNKVKY